MPKRNKNRKRNTFNTSVIPPKHKLYEMDIEIDEHELPLFEQFCNDVIKEHNETFFNCDLFGLPVNEQIENLKKRYIFYHNYFPKYALSVDDSLAVAKNNYLCMLIKSIRDVAKKFNLEYQLSLVITNESLLPMDLILKKYHKHRFQYSDDMDYLQDLHSKLVCDDIPLEFISPKFIINNYDDYDNIKNIFFVGSLVSNKSQKCKKIMSYFEKFELLFPNDFCIDLHKCFTDSIKSFKSS